MHEGHRPRRKRGAAARWLLATACLVTAFAAPAQSPVRVLSAAGDFDDVVESLRDAVIVRGYALQAELHTGEMLHRTAADIGIEGRVFERAQGIEFCSAALTHRMVRVDPANVVLCPFRLMAYTLSGDPGTVHVAFPHHDLVGEGDELADEISGLLDDIAREALGL